MGVDVYVCYQVCFLCYFKIHPEAHGTVRCSYCYTNTVSNFVHCQRISFHWITLVIEFLSIVLKGQWI